MGMSVTSQFTRLFSVTFDDDVSPHWPPIVARLYGTLDRLFGRGFGMIQFTERIGFRDIQENSELHESP